ncbi:MAG: protein kinase [Planctomycetota bacterium JB042]
MEDRAPPPSSERSARAEEIVARCLEDAPERFDDAIDAACREHEDLAPTIRAQAEAVAALGLSSVAADRRFPERLGEFELKERLGDGGMGVVYRAVQTSLGREVALKLIRPERLLVPGARERFRREARAVATLEHEGIVPIHTVGEERGLPYFVMERIEGATVAEILRGLADRAPDSLTGADLRAAVEARAGRPAEPTGHAVFRATWCDGAAAIAAAAARALAHAHARGVLHRDVKPSNLAVDVRGRALLFDFGLQATEGASRVTRTGSTLGTLAYMAPEQLRAAAETDARSDVYSLGVSLYEMLTLRLPHPADDAARLQRAILEDAPARPRALHPGVPRDLETVCLRAIDADPARRYPDAAAFADDLENVLARRPIVARRPRPFGRLARFAERQPRLAAALALLLFVLAAAPSLLLWRETRHSAVLAESVERERLARRRAERLTDLIVDTFSAADPTRHGGREPTAREALDAGLARVLADVDDPALEAELLGAGGRIVLRLGDVPRSIELLERGLAASHAVFGERHETTTAIRSYLASARAGSGDAEAAVRFARALVRDLDAWSGPTDPRTVEARFVLVRALVLGFRTEEAVAELDRALAAAETADPPHEPTVARARLERGRIHLLRGRPAEALPDLEWVDARQRRLHPEPHPEGALSRHALASACAGLGRIDRAIALHEEGVAIQEALHPDGHPELATALTMLADALGAAEDDGARARRRIEVAERARTMQEAVAPEDGRLRRVVLVSLAEALARSDPARAAAAFEEAAPLAEGRADLLAYLLGNAALCHAAAGDAAAAREAADRAIDAGADAADLRRRLAARRGADAGDAP